MLPLQGRARLRHILVVVAFTAAPFAESPSVRASHNDVDDPVLYGEPHAGWEAPPRGTGRLAPATGALLGTHSDDSHSGTVEDQKITETEAAMGRRLDINNSYYGSFDSIARKWEPGNPDKRGLSWLAWWDVENGRIPLIGWGCGKSSEIARGDHDDVIRKTAEAMKAFGHEFFLRYCWEMDGSKRISTVGDPEDFIAAWRRIHRIFTTDVGAHNVIWVWCGNAAHFKHTNDKGKFAWDYYPGDEYVDWVSADGYNWGVSKRNSSGSRDRWRGFVEIFDEFMVWARSTGPSPAGAPSKMPAVFPLKREVKPIMIGEYGVQEQPDDPEAKATWFRMTHDAINGGKPRTEACPWCGIYRDIAAMVYFDVEAVNGDWRILSGPESTAAFREAAQDPWFNQIHTLGWPPAAGRPDAPPPGPAPAPQPQPAPEPQPGPAPGGSGGSSAPPALDPAPARAVRSGYWMVDASGGVYGFGDARRLGDAAGRLPAGVEAADIEVSPSGDGYWIVDSGGTVHGFGDAGHHGNVASGALRPGETVTSLSGTPTGRGYWLFTTTGRVLAFGDALHHGDMAAAALNGPVLDSVPTPSGRGYYMVAADGGIFTFGDARFAGSMGGIRLNAPVMSLVPDPDGAGYWLVAADGGVFAFDAAFRGSMGNVRLNQPVVGMVAFGDGYLMVAADGGIFNFSSRPFHGSLGDRPPARPVTAATPLHG